MVRDASAPQSLKLTSLYLSAPGIDLSEIKDLPLETISIPATVKNIDVLRSMKTLKSIRQRGKPRPVVEFWKQYDQTVQRKANTTQKRLP